LIAQEFAEGRREFNSSQGFDEQELSLRIDFKPDWLSKADAILIRR
jgi:hypothetical protein